MNADAEAVQLGLGRFTASRGIAFMQLWNFPASGDVMCYQLSNVLTLRKSQVEGRCCISSAAHGESVDSCLPCL